MNALKNSFPIEDNIACSASFTETNICKQFSLQFQVSTVIFQTVIPDHWCDVPGIENTDMTASEWKNFTIPW